MGLFLFLVSKVLSLVLSIPALLHDIAGAIRYKGGWKYIDDSFKRSALAEDVYANIAYATMLNDLFLKHGGWHYGYRDETISSATGKNWALGKLAFLGKGLAGTLNLIDFKNWKNGGHCWVSIQGDRSRYNKPDPVGWHYTASFILIASVIIYSLIKLTIWILVTFFTFLLL